MGDAVRPFSNGTSRDHWMSGNCDGGCVKAIDWTNPKRPFRCAIQSALVQAFATGTITQAIAERAGFDVPRDYDGYFPCGEFNDERATLINRGPRPIDGQTMMEDT